MATVSATNLLTEIKSRLDITGTYHDSKLNGYISDVKEYLIDGGVDSNVVDDSCAVGVISRGVSDLWNYGAGDGDFSPYFRERAIQMSLVHIESEGES